MKLLCYETLGSLSEMFSLLKMFDPGGCLRSGRNSISTVRAGQHPRGYHRLALQGAGSQRTESAHLCELGCRVSWMRLPICPCEQVGRGPLQHTGPQEHPQPSQRLSLLLGIYCSLQAPCPAQATRKLDSRTSHVHRSSGRMMNDFSSVSTLSKVTYAEEVLVLIGREMGRLTGFPRKPQKPERSSRTYI